jgi:tRNA (mo5U34)-methyltransferase
MRTTQELADLRAQVDAVPHWYHCFDFGDGITTPGMRHCDRLLEMLELPEDMSGLRVLDLGARDGYFSFVCEQRGAREVIAVDYFPRTSTGFDVAAKVLHSERVQYIQANIYHLPDLGTFDIVLFLGLLYHLPDLLGALNIVRSLTTGAAYIETQAIDAAVLMPDGSFTPLPDTLRDVPLVQFYPRGVLYGDSSNFWAPNITALVAMLTDTGFAVESVQRHGQRAVAKCVAAENRPAAHRHAVARNKEAMPR